MISYCRLERKYKSSGQLGHCSCSDLPTIPSLLGTKWSLLPLLPQSTSAFISSARPSGLVIQLNRHIVFLSSKRASLHDIHHQPIRANVSLFVIFGLYSSFLSVRRPRVCTPGVLSGALRLPSMSACVSPHIPLMSSNSRRRNVMCSATTLRTPPQYRLAGWSVRWTLMLRNAGSLKSMVDSAFHGELLVLSRSQARMGRT